MDLFAYALAAVVAVLAFTWVVPEVMPYGWSWLLRVVYRFRVHGRLNVPRTGPALIVCNHTSYLDWLLLAATCPRRPRFVLWSGYYRYPILRVLLSWVRRYTIPIENRSLKPHAVAEALNRVVALLDAGEIVVIFPEGRLTRNGQLQAFGRGMERILAQAKGDVPVIPVFAAGLWGSVFSHKNGRILRRFPTKLRRRVSLWYGVPLPGRPTAGEAYAAVAEAGADLAVRESEHELPVPRWAVRTAAGRKNFFRVGTVDTATGTERVLTFGRVVVAAWGLSKWLRPRVGASGPVGVWLPTGTGSTLANFALGILRRPTVNLNYTAGADAVESAARQAGVTHVVTARRFDAKVPLTLPPDVTRVYLEDALAGLSKAGNLFRFVVALLLPARVLELLLGLHRIRPDDVLTIVFSSGSTGEPKGVILTHRNIASNAHAFHRGVDLRPADRMLATLPFFHSFGYTVCLWAPLGIGMPVVYHPDPRAAKEVGDLAARHKPTIMLATATFLRFYLRRCAATDFASMRLLICGAEKLPVRLAEEFGAKFGVLPLEGYGCTEVSPVVSTNLPPTVQGGVKQEANRMGTVGRPIPGVAVKAFDPDTLAPLPPDADGNLGVRGPNVTPGYLGRPDLTKKAFAGHWYLTGDIGRVEPDGFIRITGRLSRFAKIAGEMIPLERIEDEMQELFGSADRLVAAVPVPCDRRGERVVVLYLPAAAAELETVLAGLPKRGLPNLWVPDRRDCYEVEGFPALGSGKLDLKTLGDQARTLAGRG